MEQYKTAGKGAVGVASSVFAYVMNHVAINQLLQTLAILGGIAVSVITAWSIVRSQRIREARAAAEKELNALKVRAEEQVLWEACQRGCPPPNCEVHCPWPEDKRPANCARRSGHKKAHHG